MPVQVTVRGDPLAESAAGEVTLDDLPETLDVKTKPAPAAAATSTVAAEAMGSQDVLDYVNSTISCELAGDPNAIKEPGNRSCLASCASSRAPATSVQ